MESAERKIADILSKLDSYFRVNDYDSAEDYLLSQLETAVGEADVFSQIPILNELMGLYRKTGKREQALAAAESALELTLGTLREEQVGAATTYLNTATVYKAFGMAADAIPLFEKAKKIYESSLVQNDGRLGGLYNNMALALVDLGRFAEAKELYLSAIEVVKHTATGPLEAAITYLNMATAAETERGLVDAEEEISGYLNTAKELLDNYTVRDGYYAFVCEKCASVFTYYGLFLYGEELCGRARRIYEGA